MWICREEWGADDVSGGMAAAAEGGHEAIVRLCHDMWGATEEETVNTAMDRAARKGHEAIVGLCHEVWGAQSTWG